MSVLNQSGEEQVECPLCMEPLEVDDLNFFPCTCGYQICRFCWHRIRTDENGLCPACRKAYSEDPADFIPLSKEQVAQLKADKRQRDQQRKAKLSESRKHLASVRVVQRNLVFVVGLPMRLADPEILKKYEYFGKFGKIHKVVINQSTSYAGTQGPSASAYVTYMKSDDALRAIQNVNNTNMDGKIIKTSLGTTKYCSHFMKNQPCPKPDCMYLHDFGDPEASFTKEQMHAGKHQEYEKKLHEALLSRMAIQASTIGSSSGSGINAPVTSTEVQKPPSKQKEVVVNVIQLQHTNKENWPQLKSDKTEKDKQKSKKSSKGSSGTIKLDKRTPPPTLETKSESKEKINEFPEEKVHNKLEERLSPDSNVSKLPSVVDDNSSFFSLNTFTKISDGEVDSEVPHILPHIEPLLDINTDNWDLNFGFTKHSNHLEELAKQRVNVKDTLETFGNNFGDGEPFGKLENNAISYGQLDHYNNTENMLETLAKNGMHYNQNIQISNGHYNVANGHKDVNGLNGVDQHMSKIFTEIYRNSFAQPQQQQSLNSNIHNNLTQIRDSLSHINGVNQPNGYHRLQQQQLEKQAYESFQQQQQQRQLEEQLLNLNLAKQTQLNYSQMNGHYDIGHLQNGGGAYGSSLSSTHLFGNSAISSGKNRPILEDKELDYGFQETQKALEELVESDCHMQHSVGRTNLGTSQINSLVHNQSGSHLNHMPPPPPGFMQPNTHMNSFGSKILPYLNMSNQQLNSTQNWSSSLNQLQQNQQRKSLGTCNDWKVLDPAILSSRRHIPNMQMDQYSPLQLNSQSQPQLQNGPQRPFDNTYNNGFSNYSPLQHNYNNYSHLTTQQNLNWLGSEINTQISSPPGFRTSGQANKQQQEC